MRQLRFIVNEQIIKADPNCDFSGIGPGTEGYLQVEFSFSPEWNGCVKAAKFSSTMGKEYETVILKDGKSCMIPAEALKFRSFRIRLLGRRDNFTLTTNYVTVRQDGGKS